MQGDDQTTKLIITWFTSTRDKSGGLNILLYVAITINEIAVDRNYALLPFKYLQLEFQGLRAPDQEIIPSLLGTW